MLQFLGILLLWPLAFAWVQRKKAEEPPKNTPATPQQWWSEGLIMTGFLCFCFFLQDKQLWAWTELEKGGTESTIPFFFLLCTSSFGVYLLHGLTKGRVFSLLWWQGIFEKQREIIAEEGSPSPVKQDYIWSIVAIVATTSYYPLFLYFQNLGESSFGQIGPFLFLFLVFALGLFAILCKKTKDVFASALVVSIFMLIFENFASLEEKLAEFFILITRIHYWHALYVTAVFMGLLWLLFYRNLSRDWKEGLLQMMAISYTALLLWNGFSTVPSYAMSTMGLTQESVSYSHVPGQTNVYYFLYDEFADTETLEMMTGFDNSAFDEGLEELGFTVSPNSVSGSNSKLTYTIATNYMGLDHIVSDETPEPEKHALRMGNNPWLALMGEAGYQSHGIANSEFLGVPSQTQTEKDFFMGDDGRTMSQILLDSTMLYVFVENTTWFIESFKVDIINALAYLAEGDFIQADHSMFYVGYLCTPHIPYFFDADGNHVSATFYNNSTDDKFYLNQVQYISDQILLQMEAIIQKDPNCIIILQSDHSCRSFVDKNSLDFYYNTRIINAVYYQGEAMEEIVGATGLDSIRFVLNRLFDLDYEPLGVQ